MRKEILDRFVLCLTFKASVKSFDVMLILSESEWDISGARSVISQWPMRGLDCIIWPIRSQPQSDRCPCQWPIQSYQDTWPQWPAFASHQEEFVSWYIMTTHQSGLVFIASNLFITSAQSPKPMGTDYWNLFSELTFSLDSHAILLCSVSILGCSFVEYQRIPCRSIF